MNSFHCSSDGDGVIHRKKKDTISFRNVSFGCLISCKSHCGQNDFRVWKLSFDPLYEGDRAEYFPDAGGVDPNWLFKGEAREEPHSLDQFLSKSLLEEAPEEEIGGSENKENSNKGIV